MTVSQVQESHETHTTPPSGTRLVVRKRDGRLVDFDRGRILRAVGKAFIGIGRGLGPAETRAIEHVTTSVEEALTRRAEDPALSSGPADIDEIQRLVEHALVEVHEYQVAEAYTSFRLHRDIEREKATDVNEAVRRLLDKDRTLVNENANKDSNVFATQRDLLAGSVSKATAFGMLPADVANAHLKGQIHFHDADYSPFTAMTNCSLPDFGDMLSKGFVLADARMESPRSIGTASTQITQIIKDVAGSQYGGQTVNRCDEMLEPYARLDYAKHLDMARLILPDGTPIDAARCVVEGVRGRQADWLHLDGREDREPIPEDVPFDPSAPELDQQRDLYAQVMTRKSIYDAMQTMEYQINSNRVSNGQTPFVTVGFGLGTSWFAREIQRAIFLNRIRGLGAEGRTAIFPKLVFTVKHGLNAQAGDPNYDMKQLALECASTRMYPDILFFENIVAITGSFKAPMGCRSFLHAWTDPETGEQVEDGRMNLGVVTLNLPRLALESRGDAARFHRLLEERAELVHRALRFRIERCREADPKNASSLYQYGAFGRLGPEDEVDQLFRDGRATISLGFIGLYEATAVFHGKDWITDHAWDAEAKEFALDVLRRLRDRCRQWEAEEGYHYAVYSTPAESLTDRFARMDAETFGRIEGVTDHEFYTNSFHYPVWLRPTPMEKLDFERDFPPLTAGGFINYCEFPSMQQNPRGLEAVWDHAHRVGIGYLGTNTPIDRCFLCGYEGDFEPTADGFVCPGCGNDDPRTCNVTKRTCGYLGSPVERPMVHGRHREISRRTKHLEGQTGRVVGADGSERVWWDDEPEQA